MELVAAIGVFFVSWLVARWVGEAINSDMTTLEVVLFSTGAAMVAYVIAS